MYAYYRGYHIGLTYIPAESIYCSMWYIPVAVIPTVLHTCLFVIQSNLLGKYLEGHTKSPAHQRYVLTVSTGWHIGLSEVYSLTRSMYVYTNLGIY